MSAYNPRVLARTLDDLSEEILRWASAASEALSSATHSQRQAHEAVERGLHDAAVVLDRAQQDDDEVRRAFADVTAALDKCATARDIAHHTYSQAQAALQQSEATLTKWQAELEKALAWLERAKARLARAIEEYNQAILVLRNAQSRLRSAESSLSNCRGDRERKNCWGEELAVRAASAAVATAQQQVEICRQEVEAAKEEVTQAEARVACCRQAVVISQQAVALSKQCQTDATQAVNSAENSLEFAQAADRMVRVAQDRVSVELEAANRMMTTTRHAQTSADEGGVQLQRADQLEEATQRYSLGAQQELAHRVQLLQELNRPTLDGASPTLQEGTHGYPYQKARKTFILNSLSDPSVAKHIKGWIKQEVKRVGEGGYLRSPPGYDVGHKMPGIDHPENFHWENRSMNRSKGAKHKHDIWR